MFEEYLTLWKLVPDGQPFRSTTRHLLPVRRDGFPAMLKVTGEPEEQRGAAFMAWWQGEGAARVLEYDGRGLLLERATGSNSLIEMSRIGRDEEATRILCAAIARLHSHKGIPAEAVPLHVWFRDLAPAALRFGGILQTAAVVARELFASETTPLALHGDIHHGNVLDFGSHGWLAIDPKGLCGDRTFDYANLFCNPDPAIALDPAIFSARLKVVSHCAQIEENHLLRWILAWAGLSASWMLMEGDDATTSLTVAKMAAGRLGLG